MSDSNHLHTFHYVDALRWPADCFSGFPVLQGGPCEASLDSHRDTLHCGHPDKNSDLSWLVPLGPLLSSQVAFDRGHLLSMHGDLGRQHTLDLPNADNTIHTKLPVDAAGNSLRIRQNPSSKIHRLLSVRANRAVQKLPTAMTS